MKTGTHTQVPVPMAASEKIKEIPMIDVRTQFKQYDDSRRIGFNISWKFNATKSRYKGSHAGQSERNRL